MRGSPKVQVIGFAAVVVVLAAVIAWAGSSAWNHLGQLRQDLSALQTESFHVADHLEAAILGLNEIVLRFDQHSDPDDLAAFAARSSDLKQWIRDERPHMNTAREKELLDWVGVAFDTYVARTKLFLQGRTATSRESIPAVDFVVRESADYIARCRQLDEAQQGTLKVFGRESHRTTILLQNLLAFEVILLLSFWTVVAFMLYRTMVAPLRAKLIAARERVERQEKMASLGTLAAGVAHEIRNPLTAIKVRLHSLQKMLSVGSSEEEDAVVIGSEIQRLDRIVRDFLEFGRPTEPKFQTVAASDLLASVHQLFREQFRGSPIEIIVEASPPATLRADPQQIQQALINLVRNATESITGPGRVTLRAFTQRATLHGRVTPVVVLEVADTGPGIPADVQKRLFDPFFTTKESGTGLGLSIAAQIVQKHGGALQFQTKASRGTLFQLVLPSANNHES